ncbi:hypothetical protein, partial [Planomonospora alba]|uniref:hypothetical protein n=1 Tax=Planomonospora alba TaxID=161354 RepID=UPI0031EA1C55
MTAERRPGSRRAPRPGPHERSSAGTAGPAHSLRLVLPALVSWAVALALLGLPPWAGAAAGAAAGAGAGAGAVALRTRRRG